MRIAERNTRKVVARAVPRIVESLSVSGVTDVKWFLAYAGEPVIWLVTATDADKSRVAERGCHRDMVRRLLVEEGLAPALAGQVPVTVESEEAVARDFQGSWFYAMK